MKLGTWLKSEPALYLVAAMLSIGLLVPFLRLDAAELTAPLQPGGDGAFYQGIVVKPLTVQGWYLSNPALSAPGGLLLYDFPTGTDSLLYLILKAIGMVTPDTAVVLNMFYLLTFPLAALAMLVAARYFGLSKPVSVAVSLLYAFAPYHFARGQGHLMLSAYFVLPLGLVVAFAAAGESERARRDGGGGAAPRWWAHLLTWHVGWMAAFSIGAALTGVYYAFCYGATLIVLGAKRAIDRRSWAPMLVPVVLGAVLASAVAASALPTFVYHAREGSNAFMESDRGPGGAEIYALRLIQLIMPPRGHRVPVFDAAADRYAEHLANISPILDNEAGSAALGLVASAGFVLLLAWTIFAIRERSDGPWRRYSIGDLAVVNMSMFLLGTAGGFGLVVASLVSPLLRAYNRVSIYIAALALIAVGAALDRFAARFEARRWVSAALAAVLLVVGLADQTQPVDIAEYDRARVETATLRAFGDQVESALPAGAMVFQLPYVTFPGSAEAIATGFGEYTHLLPYIYSDGLRWSFAAMNGRETAQWQERTARMPAAEMLQELRAKGFKAVYVDRAGFEDEGAALVSELSGAIGTADVTSSDGRRLLWVLGE